MADDDQRSTPIVIRNVLTDPHWWFKDVVVALILDTLISGGSVVGQMIINDHRVARETIWPSGFLPPPSRPLR